jgi:NADH dehydrogenase/NADH:ubiquinone oxidoreductase subunit G
MCLVEVDKVPKPLAACATPITNNMGSDTSRFSNKKRGVENKKIGLIVKTITRSFSTGSTPQKLDYA